ncbi:MAG: thermonuclease family protein, partial [Variibacter sp.]|nr:thermonuclease family protein [Variibacter sp.]
MAGALVVACAGSSVAAPCGAGETTSGIVKAVADERTLVLENGRLLRLAGLDIPPGETPALARKFLTDEILGRSVTVRAGSPPDRHGRLPSFIFLSPGGLERFVQHAMVNQGLARFAPPAGGRPCADELLAREREARAAGRGLWAQAAHAVQRADDPGAVQALRGRFALVEGRVLSVRESGGTVYVNFGRRWSEDFTVTVAKRN